MKPKTDAEAVREALTAEVIELFVSIIGFIPRHSVSAKSNFIRDFDIIDADLTCFMMQVKWQYKLRPIPADWARVETIEGVVELILAQR